MRRLVPCAVLLVLPLLVFAALPALAAEIRLTDTGFSPRSVSVEVGQDIVWVNASEREHTVVGEDGTWDSGPLRPGETFSIALRDAGTIRYATADGVLQGVIRVREAAPEEDGTPEDEEAVEPVDAVATAAAEPTAEPVALPNTGTGAGALLGLGLLLAGGGALLVRRASGPRP